MKVEIWAEVTCPWCGLGSHRLDRAVERFEHGDEVEVVHHSFPLSSSFPVDETFSVREALLRRHGMDHLVPALETVLGHPANLGLDLTTVLPELTMAPHVPMLAPLLPLYEASLAKAHDEARCLGSALTGRPAA
jgi:predicted DsbA family dithiol-disulfide isomerase